MDAARFFVCRHSKREMGDSPQGKDIDTTEEEAITPRRSERSARQGLIWSMLENPRHPCTDQAPLDNLQKTHLFTPEANSERLHRWSDNLKEFDPEILDQDLYGNKKETIPQLIMRKWYVTEEGGGISKKKYQTAQDRVDARETNGMWDPLKHRLDAYPATYNTRCRLPPYECRPLQDKYCIGRIEAYLPSKARDPDLFTPFKALHYKKFRDKVHYEEDKGQNTYVMARATVDAFKNIHYQPDYELKPEDIKQAAKWYDKTRTEEQFQQDIRSALDRKSVSWIEVSEFTDYEADARQKRRKRENKPKHKPESKTKPKPKPKPKIKPKPKPSKRLIEQWEALRKAYDLQSSRIQQYIPDVQSKLPRIYKTLEECQNLLFMERSPMPTWGSYGIT